MKAKTKAGIFWGRFLIIISLFFPVMTGASARGYTSPTSPPALVMVAVRSSADQEMFAQLGASIYGQVYTSGSRYLLAPLSALQQAELLRQGLSLRTLDGDSRSADYYLLTDKHDFHLPGWLRPLYQDSRQALVKLTEAEYLTLTQESHLLARRLELHPLVLESNHPDIPTEITPDPIVQQIINLVVPETVWSLDGSLSGEWPVSIGGGPYQIRTRYSRTDVPIQKATQYAYEFFESQMLATSYHTYTLPSTGSRRNVVAEQPGLGQPERVFLITAHLDSTSGDPYNNAPGADDNASGSTAVLMASDILSNYLFDCTLRYVLFTGEEQGLYGSSAYAQDVFQAGDQIEAVLNLDMIGYNSDANPVFELHTRFNNTSDLEIANLFVDVINAYELPLNPQIVQDGIQASDHASFWDYGFPAILGIEDFQDFTPYYHTTNDRLQTLDLNYFTAAVRASLATFAHMGCMLSHEEVGNLAGVVSDAADQTPISAAYIEVTDGQHTWDTTTGSNGAYRFNLPPATYSLLAQADGYTDVTTDTITVSDGLTTTLDLAMQPLPPQFYTVSGYVRDQDTSEPLSATVQVLGSALPPIHTDPTSGFYTLDLEPGSYSLRAQADGYGSITENITLDGDLLFNFELPFLCQPIESLDWAHSPITPMVGQTVIFTATVVGGTPPLTFTWNFDDGGPLLIDTDLPVVAHNFPPHSTNRAYQVALSVSNVCTTPLLATSPINVQAYLLHVPVVLH